MSVQHYRQLKVWQMAMDVAEKCYQVTKSFPKEEMFSLTSQIRRAATSVAANIAEGQGRRHTREFLNHISMSRGSLLELETLLLLGERVRLISTESNQQLMDMCDQIGRMLSGLRQSLERKLDE